MSKCICLNIGKITGSNTPKPFEIIANDFNVDIVAYVPLFLPVFRTVSEIGP